MIFVEPRAVTRWYHEWLAVLVALILTLLTVSVLLAAIGLDPLSSLHRIFIKPLNSVYGISELLAKSTPLITIGVALALGFRQQFTDPIHGIQRFDKNSMQTR